MTGRSNPPPSNTPPVSAASASNTETTNTTTTSLSIAAVTSQAQTTPQTSSGATTVTTSALPSTVVTSMIGAPSGSLTASAYNYRLTPNISLYHTDRIRRLDGTNRCGEHSILFLCHLFGIPRAQVPLPVRVPTDDYQYLDLMTPIGNGISEGAFDGDIARGVGMRQISCVHNATQQLLNTLDKTLPYLLTTSAVSGGHTVALFFDYHTNCWAIYNSQARNPVVVITDRQGNLNAGGRQILPLHDPRHVRPDQRHRVDICPMSPQRVHFLMRYIYRLRTTHRRRDIDPVTNRTSYSETFADFENRVLSLYRDEIVSAAVDYTVNGSVDLPDDFDPERMLSRALPDRSVSPSLQEFTFSLPSPRGARQEGTVPRRARTEAPILQPEPSRHPCPAGYEECFSWAQLGRPVNQIGELFDLREALTVAGIISSDPNNPHEGDFITVMPVQAGDYQHSLGVLDRDAVYMLPFYRSRGQGPYQGTWRSVVLLQFVDEEWRVFSAAHGPNVLTTNGGNTIPAANARTHFNPQTRLPLNSEDQPYFPIYRMTPERFANIMRLNQRLQASIDINAAIARELNITESVERFVQPAADQDAASEQGGASPSQGAASGTSQSVTQPQPATLQPAAVSSAPSQIPPPRVLRQPQQQLGQNGFTFSTQVQDISHLRPDDLDESPYPRVDSARYQHLLGTSCVDQSLDFLSQYFGLPIPQWPAPQTVQNRGALDIAGPLIFGQLQGTVRPWPLGRDNFETRETDRVALFNFLDQELDKETAYLMYTEDSDRYGSHIVVLYFDYFDNEWFAFNNSAAGCNGQPVKITDLGNFTQEGSLLFTPRIVAQQRGAAAAGRRLQFFAMDNERTEFMCEYVRRERLRDPRTPRDLFPELNTSFPHRHITPALEDVTPSLPRTHIPEWFAPFDFSLATPEQVLRQPPEQNMQPAPMVPQERYTHLAGIGCAEQSLEFAARCFGIPAPVWNEVHEVNYARALDLFGTLGFAAANGMISPDDYNVENTYVTSVDQANRLFFGERPLLNEERMYLMGVQGSAYNSHLVVVYFDQALGRWFAFNNVAQGGSETLGDRMFVKPVPLTNGEGSLTSEGRRLLLPVTQFQPPPPPRQPGEPEVAVAPRTYVGAAWLTSEIVEFLCNWVLRVRGHGLPHHEGDAVIQSFVRRYQTPAAPPHSDDEQDNPQEDQQRQ